MSQPVYPQGKSPWYPLDKGLGGPQSCSECSGEEKNSQPLPGLETPIIQPALLISAQNSHDLNYIPREVFASSLSSMEPTLVLLFIAVWNIL
jgi:hypothetical protein